MDINIFHISTGAFVLAISYFIWIMNNNKPAKTMVDMYMSEEARRIKLR